MLGVLSVLLGIVYPLIVTCVAWLAFPYRANGSLVTFHGVYVGSELVGQLFSSPAYFHGRPSECLYDAGHSSGANLGPSNPRLAEQARERIETLRIENGLSAGERVPVDLVVASGSGLDPEISPEAALVQVNRIADNRSLPASVLRELVIRNTGKPFIGVFGRPRVNVLKLNVELDEILSGTRHSTKTRNKKEKNGP
jgi:K+-transporting ATPase ATPase C chain